MKLHTVRKQIVLLPISLLIGLSPLGSRPAQAMSLEEAQTKVQDLANSQYNGMYLQYLAWNALILELQGAQALSAHVGQNRYVNPRLVAGGVPYVIAVALTGRSAFRQLARIGKLPKLILAKGSALSKLGSILGGAPGVVARAAVVGGVFYLAQENSKILMLNPADYEEILMNAQAQVARLELKIGAEAKKSFLPQSSSEGSTSAEAAVPNDELFKLED